MKKKKMKRKKKGSHPLQREENTAFLKLQLERQQCELTLREAGHSSPGLFIQTNFVLKKLEAL